jgi:hypothetical protein
MINKYGIEIPNELYKTYCKKLIGDFYKLLPISEGKDKTGKIIYSEDEAYKMFQDYLKSFVYELCGAFYIFDDSEYFLTVLNIAEGMKKIQKDQHKELKSLVMKCISICKKLSERGDS